MSEPILDDAAFARIFGLRRKAERDFAEDLVRALEKIDRALLPAAAPHPFASLIFGHDTQKLLALAEGDDARKRKDAIDALAHVLVDHDVVGPGDRAAACERLRALMAKSAGDAELAAALENTLAIARDPATLIDQLKRLGSDDPGTVATAARLLGLGRYAPAVPVLKGLIAPERGYESRWVIWALGEIGDPAALPALELALANGFRIVDCVIAIGKIGKLASIPKLTPHLSGLPDQKDAAVRSLAMILDDNRDDALRMGALRDQLATSIERDLADPKSPMSGSTRFHMLLCLARLGQKLDEARVKRYLGIVLDEKEAKQVAVFIGARVDKKRNVFSRARPAKT